MLYGDEQLKYRRDYNIIYIPRNELSKLRTNPATAAVVVAMAGTIRPAMSLALSLSTFSIEYTLARRFYSR